MYTRYSILKIYSIFNMKRKQGMELKESILYIVIYYEIFSDGC